MVSIGTMVASAVAVTATSALMLTLWTKAQVLYGAGSKKLQGFRITKVLKLSEKEISLLGTFASDPTQRPAVLTIQKTAFDSKDLQALLQTISLHQILENDVYSTYVGDVARLVKPFKVNLIHPATETHIRKHMDQAFHMVVETKAIYETITRPFIESLPVEKIEWVYNILDHKTESERIIYEDPDKTNGFILLPDFKWSDTSNIESIYCLAITHDRTIRSLRDLTAAHVPLLKNVRDASLAILTREYGVPRSSFRVYVHYQPTYYHFHVHFSHVKITDGTHTGKAVLLDEIIYNLSTDGSYYQNASLSLVVGEMQHKPLVERFIEHGVLKPTGSV